MLPLAGPPSGQCNPAAACHHGKAEWHDNIAAMVLDLSAATAAPPLTGHGLAYAHSPQALADPGLREQLRNSVIQAGFFLTELEDPQATPGADVSQPGRV